MEVLSNTANVEVPAVVTRVKDASRFDCRADAIDNAVLVFVCKEISDLARRKKIVDEHKELFISDLTLSQEEHNTFVLKTRLIVHNLKICLEIVKTVGR